MKNRPLACVCLILPLVLLACAAGTQLPGTTPAPSQTSNLTPRPSLTPLPTWTLDQEATRQAGELQAVVQALADQGFLASSAGRYHPLQDYSQDWAKIEWYWWTTTVFSPADFVFRGTFAWQSGSRTPDPSGCGLVFHVQPGGDHYLVFLSTSGELVLGASLAGSYQTIGQAVYGPASPDGQADFVLAVSGHSFRVLVDGQPVATFTGYTGKLEEGGFGFAVVSGTNAGFGTRCQLTGMGLWQIRP